MKGVSVLVTIFLFVAAIELANVLKQAGVSPADKEASQDTRERWHLAGAQFLTAEHALTNVLGPFASYEHVRSSISQ